MNSTTAIIGGAAAAVVIAAGIYMIDIDQTQETRMPDVDVSVNGGQLPEFEAEVGSVSVEQEDVTVDVPDVEVTMEEKRLTVPTLDIDPPSDDS